METFFKNVDPALVADADAQSAARRLWAADGPGVAAAAGQVLQGGDVVALCVLFDVYSYGCTTEGLWISDSLSALHSTLASRARELLDAIWSGRLDVAMSLRDSMVASGMHMVWRAVDMEDKERVLHSLRFERHWRIVAPSVSAAGLMRGNDRTFDRAVAPLLTDVARRPDLSMLVRRTAVEAFTESPTAEDLQILANLIPALPPAPAAAGALILLDSGAGYEDLVRSVASKWRELDEYPVPDVLQRTARPDDSGGQKQRV